jgi:hypothetical protein
MGGDYWATFCGHSWQWVQDDAVRRRVLTLYDGEMMLEAGLSDGPEPFEVVFPEGFRIDADMEIENIHRTGNDVQWVTFGFIDDEIMLNPVSYMAAL